MKITLTELRSIVASVVSEVKKKAKKKKEEDGSDVQPKGFTRADAHDFSRSADGLYGRQGAANLGPYTAEAALRGAVGRAIAEVTGMEMTNSERIPMDRSLADDDGINETLVPLSAGVWSVAEACAARYVKEGWDLGEKRIGFQALKGKLSHEKGVKDPGALAAYIGREKYGKKGFAKKSAAGRK